MRFASYAEMISTKSKLLGRSKYFVNTRTSILQMQTKERVFSHCKRAVIADRLRHQERAKRERFSFNLIVNACFASYL
jgi:predicted RNA-binding protein YlxR (DUF448 family)